MLEAIVKERFRCWFRLVLAILGLLALSGRAEASGCHVLERPTFGIDAGPIEPRPTSNHVSELTAPAPVHYRQAPCPGEFPGLPSKIQISDSSTLSTVLLNPVVLAETRSIEIRDRCRPFTESNPLERPPRDPSLFSSA